MCLAVLTTPPATFDNSADALSAFGAALDAWGAARTGAEAKAALERLSALTPSGLTLRVDHRAAAVNVHFSGESHSAALFYLRALRGRVRCETLTSLAWVAIQAIGQAVKP